MSLLFVAREKTSRDEVERRVDALARWKLWEKYKRKKRGNALEKDRQRERERERDDACMWGSEKGKTQVDGYMMTYR